MGIDDENATLRALPGHVEHREEDGGVSSRRRTPSLEDDSAATGEDEMSLNGRPNAARGEGFEVADCGQLE